ncbi:MAG: tetratricopeptide repeat protein, partial [Vicinamibacterales bacterium]
VAPQLYYNLACTYALLGETDQALEFLTREFADIRDERQRGWSPELTARALAAVRITAGYLLGRPPNQRGAQRSTPVEGSLLCVAGGVCVAVSSDVTPETVERERRLSSEPGHDGPSALKSDRREKLDSIHHALTALTNACYRVPLELPDELLDPALASGEALTRSLLRASSPSARLFSAASARATIFNPRTWRS